MDILSGNKLIAEFMGWRFEIKDNEYGGELLAFYQDEMRWRGERPKYLNEILSSENGYGYHVKWEKLMPVVEKIWKMEFLTSLNFYTANGFNFSCEMKIYRNGIGESEIEAETSNPIETVWQTVVQFIEWYNETKLITQA